MRINRPANWHHLPSVLKIGPFGNSTSGTVCPRRAGGDRGARRRSEPCQGSAGSRRPAARGMGRDGAARAGKARSRNRAKRVDFHARVVAGAYVPGEQRFDRARAPAPLWASHQAPTRGYGRSRRRRRAAARGAAAQRLSEHPTRSYGPRTCLPPGACGHGRLSTWPPSSHKLGRRAVERIGC